MDVLRLAGVPGVGKSTVAWTLAERLADDGVRVGYVDIDQLGMCYPAPPEDPDRWLLKEAALGRVAARFAEAGAERLVVSGVADPAAPPPGNGHPTASFWLDANEETRRARLAPRGWPQEQVDEVLSVGTRETADAHPAWTMLDTAGSTVEATVRAVHARLEDAVDVAAPLAAPPEPGTTRRVIWITGPRGAGASRVGWELVSGLWKEGRRTAFIDVAQLGFARNVDAGVGMRNTAAVQGVFATAGAQTLVAVAPFEVAPDDVWTAFPDAEVWFFRLDADDHARHERVLRRAAGTDALLAGDDLFGASEQVIDRVMAVGARQRSSALRAGERLVDTTDASASHVAAQLAALLPD